MVDFLALHSSMQFVALSLLLRVLRSSSANLRSHLVWEQDVAGEALSLCALALLGIELQLVFMRCAPSWSTPFLSKLCSVSERALLRCQRLLQNPLPRLTRPSRLRRVACRLGLGVVSTDNL